MTTQTTNVVLGVDTQADTHTAAVIDDQGRLIDTIQVPTTEEGFRRLLVWASTHGHVTAAGVEGTGAYGASLTRFLTAQGVGVIEVNHPTVNIAVDTASPIPLTLSQPPERSCPVKRTRHLNNPLVWLKQ